MSSAVAVSDGSSAADPIYEDLKGRIVSREIPGDTPLRQDDIAKTHGVSKIPVREALRRLENEGLVIFRPNRGAFVRKLSDAEILDLMEIRVALECKALELAIPNMIETDFQSIEQLLAEYAKCTDPAGWSEMNQRFHHMLYEPSGNRQLVAMIGDLQRRLGPFLRRLVSMASGLDRPMREHEEILSACKASDVDRAVAVLRAHIETTKKEVAAYLRREA